MLLQSTQTSGFSFSTISKNNTTHAGNCNVVATLVALTSGATLVAATPVTLNLGANVVALTLGATLVALHLGAT